MENSLFGTSSNYPFGVPISKLGEFIEYLKNLLGNEWVLNEIQSYREWCNNNSIQIFRNVHPPYTNMLIPMFTVFDDWWRQSKKPKPPAAVIDLVTIAAAISYFKPYWSSLKAGEGRNHISSNMKNPETCRGMIYELTTAFHYVRAGATPVTPLFMKPEHEADILITWQDIEIEIHCKSKIPGAGQKIHADLFDYLAGYNLAYFRNLTNKSLHVKLICNNELESEDVDRILEKIKTLINIGLVGDYPICGNRYTLKIREIRIPPNGVPVSEVEKLHKPMYRAILADNALQTLPGYGYYRLSVFDAISRKRPRVASSLKDSIKQAIKQATGKRPSIIAIHFYDPMDWEVANKLRGFTLFLEKILQQGRGKNVGVLILSGEPLSSERWTGQVYERTLPKIQYINPYANPSVMIPANFKI